jgi:hypothetical protein
MLTDYNKVHNNKFDILFNMVCDYLRLQKIVKELKDYFIKLLAWKKSLCMALGFEVLSSYLKSGQSYSKILKI